MKIIDIQLHNIGLYKDQTVLFPCGTKEAILFWGNNGAGKTTLLTSIKVGLLGQRAISGSFEKYCDYISSNLISTRWDRSKGNASIRISVEIIDNNERKIYSILREWSFVNDVLSEDTSIFQKSEKLDFIQAEKIQHRINAALPPSLMDVLIFDGENAINLLQKDQMPSLIKNIIYSIFGMDLYAQTVRDLNSCLKKVTVANNAQEDEIVGVEISSRYRQVLNENKVYRTSFNELQNKRKQKLIILNAAIKRLSQIIGIDFETIEEVKKDVTGLQENQKKLQSEIKFITEEILPLKLLQPDINRIIKKSEEEQPYRVLQTIKALKGYFIQDKEALENLLSLEKKIDVSADNEIVLALSDSDLLLFRKVQSLLETYTKNKLMAYLDQRSSTFSTIKEKIGSLDKLSDPEAKNLLLSIEEISAELDQINEDLVQAENCLTSSEASLVEAKKQYEDYKKAVTLSKKTSNSYIQIVLYRDSIEEFIESKTVNICSSLNKAICIELQRINYRNSSIREVEIDPKSFSIGLYEIGHKLIPSNVFSAGEKQILLGIIIKESLRISGLNGFFLFDTPVGRLDMSNRSIFTNEVIFKVAQQVMVFATDSDYSKSDYESIKTRLTQERLLTRNEHDQIEVRSGSIYGEQA